MNAEDDYTAIIIIDFTFLTESCVVMMLNPPPLVPTYKIAILIFFNGQHVIGADTVRLVEHFQGFPF